MAINNKKTISPATARGSVLSFMHAQVERLHTIGRPRSGEMLQSALNRLSDFRCGADLTFTMFDSDLMQLFENHLRCSGLKRNTIGFYMRVLRTYYNIAVESGVADNRHPFRKVYTSKDKTLKRALTFDEVRRIKALDLSAKPHLDYARDMLLFSLYARGMAFVDMAYLKKSDLCGSHFVYARRKTGQMLCVEWIDQMQQIINKYGSNNSAYLLPIITRCDIDDRRQYLNRIRCIERNLKRVGEMAHVSGILTLYRARHAWATMARTRNVPVAVISEALGHDSEKTTEIYLDSIQTSVVDAVNRQLLQNL